MGGQSCRTRWVWGLKRASSAAIICLIGCQKITTPQVSSREIVASRLHLSAVTRQGSGPPTTLPPDDCPDQNRYLAARCRSTQSLPLGSLLAAPDLQACRW
ncbi:hypothetical protein XELAEV_18025308mg [Xenopus laevis]|uniref:Uncharacterized protein n=1 Tax=Xenopus laevis TaxID=8355 RepID=A0A974HLS5_XENLA|nr:hypothetical protein XELAEV_18025308mg [Xenopus laevis]